MKLVKINTRFLSILLFAILLSLFVLLFFQFKHPVFLNFILAQNSSTDIYLEGNKLKFSFNILGKDQQDFYLFLDKLGIDQKVASGVSFELDNKSIGLLEKILPQKLILRAKKGELIFNSPSLSLLQNSLATKNFSIATGSGKLDFKGSNERNFYFKAIEPLLVVNHATASGILQTASVTDKIFPSLGKVDTIELRVSGEYIAGEVKLKE